MSTINEVLLDTLRTWRHIIFWRPFLAFNNVYTRIFSRELGRVKYLEKPFEDILQRTSFTAVLDKQKNYFLLHASYADKWLILSFLSAHFHLYTNSFVIACHDDRGLVEIFFGQSVTTDRFIFIQQSPLNKLSRFFRPLSSLTMPLADSWYTGGCKHIVTSFFIDHGLPPGSIRHLHFVYYPYFNELFYLHGVSYGKLLKTLLYLPASSQPIHPTFYPEKDYHSARTISSSFSPIASHPLLPAVLFNVVNFSHVSLDLRQISLVISTLETSGYRVLLNVTQSAEVNQWESLVARHHREAVLVSIPPTLLALVCDNVHAVIGVLGGAMNVAVQFSGSHVLSLQTPAVGTACAEDELLAEWGKERIWEWYDQDWPCLHPGRVVVNAFVGDPSNLSNDSLRQIVESFLLRLPQPERTL